jgi:hypothetical protein
MEVGPMSPAPALRRALLLVLPCLAACGAANRPCPATPPVHEPVKVVLDGDDDKAATKKLAEFLKAHGFTIVTQEESAIGVRYRGLGAILLPKLDGGKGIDRVVVTRVFAPKDEHRGKPEIAELALKLNQKLNIAQFWVHDDGTLMLTSQITFLDELHLAWIAAFFDWMAAQAAQIVSVVPEAQRLLK